MYLVRNRELLKSKAIRTNTGVTYLHLKKDHCDLFCGEKTGGRARFLKKKKKIRGYFYYSDKTITITNLY